MAVVKGLADLIILPVFGRCGAAEVTQQPGTGGATSPRLPSLAREPDFSHLLERFAEMYAADLAFDRAEEVRELEAEVFRLRRQTAALREALRRRG